MLTSKKTRSSFGPDGRRVSGGLPPGARLKCVARAGSGFSSRPAASSSCGGGGGTCGIGGGRMHSSSKLFQPGNKLVVARAPVMAGLSLGGGGIQRKFQRPMTKRRSYDKNDDLALKKSTLGQKRRFDGMAKLFARAGKGLNYQAPQRKTEGDCSGTSDESESEEEEKEPERPFEPLMVWKSPHEGGEAKGLPPRL